MHTEKLILSHLILDSSYCNEVFPFIKKDYFQGEDTRTIFEFVYNFISKYDKAPSKEALIIELDNSSIPESVYEESVQTIADLGVDQSTDKKWLVDETERFCKEAALRNAILESIAIINDDKGKKSAGSIPVLVEDALSVSFNTNIGQDYFEDAESRYQEYLNKEERAVSFDIDILNTVTNGGIPKKTLNCLMAGPNVGKSMVLCHFSSSWLRQGKNVLYISLEMAEHEIMKRIECNMMGIDITDIDKVPKSVFDSKINQLKSKTNGALKVVEYPMSSASVMHFKSLLNDLRLKRKFVPDVIVIDYLNICASARLDSSSASNPYIWVKAIAEELRGLAQQFEVPIWTATQINRSGYNSTDPDMDSTSESFGLPAILDFFLAIVRTEELDKTNRLMFKQLKSRYGDKSKDSTFAVGVDRLKFKLYDVDDQSSIGSPGVGQVSIATSSKNGDSQDAKENVKKGVFRFP